MRNLPLSATTIALLLAGASSPAMAKGLTDNQIFSEYVRECILISDGSVRAYLPQMVEDGKTGALATPCNPDTEIEVIFNAPGRGPDGSQGDPGPAGPMGPEGEMNPPPPPPPPPPP